MVKRWISSLMVITLLVFLMNTISVGAAGPVNTTSRMEGVLVVDVSKSMLDSDPNKISNEAMKMFIDMSSLKGDKVGVISYANDVISKKVPVKFLSEQDKKTLKDFVDALGKYPNTDLSVGIKEAVKILKDSHEKDYFPLIVLLADGNNDLDKTKPKTVEQANDDLAQAVADAKGKGYPVYVIGLNADGKLNKDVLKNIALSTKGKFFETNNANDLPEILSEIFAHHFKLKIVPLKEVIAKDEFQDVKINVPNENVLEANISLISSKPVQLKLVDPAGKEQTIPSDKILLTTSKAYSMLKLVNPVQGEWTLKVKGFPKDKIDINLIFNNDLQLKLAPIAGQSFKSGDTVKISAFFEDNAKQIANPALYKTMKASLFIKDLETGKTEEMKLNAADEGFFGQFVLGNSANYQVTAKAEGDSFYRESQAQQIMIKKDEVAAAAKANPSVEGKPVPWLTIGIAVLGAILLIALISSLIAKRKKANRGFSGKIVLEINDDGTGEHSTTQQKKLKDFKGEFNLSQLFVLGAEFVETDQILFKPLTENALLLLNQSNCTMEKDGEVIDTLAGQRLKRNDKLRIILENGNKSIYIENIS